MEHTVYATCKFHQARAEPVMKRNAVSLLEFLRRKTGGHHTRRISALNNLVKLCAWRTCTRAAVNSRPTIHLEGGKRWWVRVGDWKVSGWEVAGVKMHRGWWAGGYQVGARRSK